MKRTKKIDGRSAEARKARAKAALREGKGKIIAAALAGEHIRGMQAGYFLAARELAHEILFATHQAGPLSALARLATKTRKAIDSKRESAS